MLLKNEVFFNNFTEMKLAKSTVGIIITTLNKGSISNEY